MSPHVLYYDFRCNEPTPATVLTAAALAKGRRFCRAAALLRKGLKAAFWGLQIALFAVSLLLIAYLQLC